MKSFKVTSGINIVFGPFKRYNNAKINYDGKLFQMVFLNYELS